MALRLFGASAKLPAPLARPAISCTMGKRVFWHAASDAASSCMSASTGSVRNLAPRKLGLLVH